MLGYTFSPAVRRLAQTAVTDAATNKWRAVESGGGEVETGGGGNMRRSLGEHGADL